MKFNDAGYQLLKEFEGCSLVSYQDQGGVWSIGYGCTHNVGPNQTITQEEAEQRLVMDVNLTATRVQSMLKHSLTDNQFSAVVCFAYNVGCGNLAKSTLLNCLNTGHIEDAANEFTRWDKVNGVPNDGLARRRKAEQALFLS